MASASVLTRMELHPKEDLRMSGEHVQGYFPSSSLEELSVDVMPFMACCLLTTANNGDRRLVRLRVCAGKSLGSAGRI